MMAVSKFITTFFAWFFNYLSVKNGTPKNISGVFFFCKFIVIKFFPSFVFSSPFFNSSFNLIGIRRIIIFPHLLNFFSVGKSIFLELFRNSVFVLFKICESLFFMLKSISNEIFFSVHNFYCSKYCYRMNTKWPR